MSGQKRMDGLALGLEDAVEGEALLEVVDVETKAEVEVEVERGSVRMTLSCETRTKICVLIS